MTVWLERIRSTTDLSVRPTRNDVLRTARAAKLSPVMNTPHRILERLRSGL